MSQLVDLLFPRTCAGCGQPGSYFCPMCQSSLEVLSVQYPASVSPLDGTLKLFRYRAAIRTLVTDLKYQFCFDVIPSLADLVSTTLHRDFPNLLSYWQAHAYCLVPVPLHWSRCNWRGFNQSELLAVALSSRLSLPWAPAVSRRRPTASQVAQATKTARLTNVTAAFAADSSHHLFGNNYLVLDDVITTGATITQAASVLQAAGAASIWALSIAG